MTASGVTPGSDLPFGPWDGPIVAIVYGRSGIGKTTDLGYFDPGALFIGIRAHLRSIAAALGVNMTALKCAEAYTIPQVTRFVLEAASMNAAAIKAGKPRRFRTVSIDDFSILAKNTLIAYQREQPDNGFYAYGAVDRDLEDMKRAARAGRLHVILNAHERPPDIKAPTGGPVMPSRNQTASIPVIAGACLRAQADPMIAGSFSWGGFYACDPLDNSWLTRCRYRAAPPKGPMNLAEIYRRAGFWLPRPAGLAWMEAEVERASAALAAGEDRASVLRPIVQQHQGKSRAALEWLVRDSIDRAALIRAHRPGLLDGLLAESGNAEAAPTTEGAPSGPPGAGLAAMAK